MELTGSAAAYLEQATFELSKDVEFSSEEDFRKWILMNIESIASKASELNKRVIRKIESGEIKQLISSKVWEECKNLEVRKRVRTEFNHIFLSDN
jgi:hypothetical protein